MYFKLYGADAAITVDDDDLLEATDANDNNVTSNPRNQATEFPRKITASYIDPAQNYMPVTVAAERLAIDITAIGEQTLQIPVVMAADQARQAVDKAMKVAYATLQGTQTYGVAFGGAQSYLSLCAGEPILFRNKRWVVDDITVGNGSLQLTTRYDRQSAYTSTVQAVVGNEPTTPASPYSGPTRLIAMNLPSLRPQDTYGLYLAANAISSTQNWRGCTAQYSLDGQVTWLNGPLITEGSTFGTIVTDEPGGGEPITVQVNGALYTITDAQLAARQNGFAVLHASGNEIGQFKTAAEVTGHDGQYQLTDVGRGLLATQRVNVSAGETFTMLDSVYFLPIPLDFSGSVIYLRGVGFGETAEDAAIISVKYTATQVIPVPTNSRIDVDGNYRIDADGNRRISF